jgi:hypothetical protein
MMLVGGQKTRMLIGRQRVKAVLKRYQMGISTLLGIGLGAIHVTF